MKTTKYIIYKITNLLNNKIYIGQHKTTNINDGYMGSGKVIRFAIKKNGKDNFKKEILFVYDNIHEMNSKERELVNEIFINQSNTYNLKTGGNKLYIVSEETKKLMSLSALNMKPELRQKIIDNTPIMTDETKRKLSIAAKNQIHKTGYALSNETKKNMKESHLGYVMPNSQKENISKALTGRIVSNETCLNISKSLMGRKLSSETKLKISNSKKKYYTNLSENERKKLRESNITTDTQKKKISVSVKKIWENDEMRKKYSEAAKNRPKIKCPHCHRLIDKSTSTRWHFDNCKLMKGLNNE